MHSDFLIIGGGIAGLSGAICLAEAGADVVLVEAGSFGSQKICGEFLSPEVLPLLDEWGIRPKAMLMGLSLIRGEKRFWYPFPSPAGALSRDLLEMGLASRAEKAGAEVRSLTAVARVIPPPHEGQPFQVELDNGETWTAGKLLLGTGRFSLEKKKSAAPRLRYVAAKAHFAGLFPGDILEMRLFPGAYFGLSPVQPDRVNIAGIFSCSAKEALDPRSAFSAYLQRPDSHGFRELLDQGTCLFEDWLCAAIPEFGIRKQVVWPNTFLVGDAAGTIPPATGDGIGIGIASGRLAAQYALADSAEGYRRAWRLHFKRRFFWGHILHRLFLTRPVNSVLPQVGRLAPWLPAFLFHATRGESRFSCDGLS